MAETPTENVVHTPPTPAQVLCRTMGTGRTMAEAVVARLGDAAKQLSELYAADDLDGIRRLVYGPEKPETKPATASNPKRKRGTSKKPATGNQQPEPDTAETGGGIEDAHSDPT